MNLANSVLSEIPKFKSFRHLTTDTADIRNIAFATSTRAKSLNRMWRDNFKYSKLGYTQDYERISKMTAYCNHIKNSELGTREVFEQETKNIPLTRQTDLVTQLNDNPITPSTDSSKNEERHETEVNPDPEPSSSDSRSKKKKRNKKKKRHKHSER